MEIFMSEFDSAPVVIFSQTKKKRKHRSVSEKLARKQDRENSLNLTRISLENIMKFYQDFSPAYQNNNLYGLFNASEGFYNNVIEFISLSHHLFKHKLIKVNDIDSGTIIQNMNIIIAIIDELNTKRIEWISESNILDDLKFANTVAEGSNRINFLQEKIQKFLDRFSVDVQNEKDHLQNNGKYH